MEKLDYRLLGLKCGLEIHQQLDTKKLFCMCPSIIIDAEPDFLITRKLRSSAGETGEVDVAALHEAKKDKVFLYEGYFSSTCLVESDEEPPHALNQEALQIVLQVSKMLGMHVVDQIQVMRKTVIDGSNTAGFQRTALVARDGQVSVNGKTIRIPTICIEEDAARIIKTEKEFTVYRLDRLGIPLIELATHADITTPEEAREVAEYLGMILRSTGKVKRGLGTIRQDVNVSIKNGSRVEIKGAQDLRQLSKLVEYEAIRQKTLLELKETVKKPKHALEIKELTSIFKKTECTILSNKPVLGIKVEGFYGLLGKNIQPGKRLGSELSDHGKTAGVKGLFHSDEDLGGYGLSEEEIDGVKDALDVGKNDAFILIGEKKERAELALEKVIERIMLLFEKIPSEVRKANEDGTSTYLRPMPGGSRMYPETDIRPIIADTKNIVIPMLLTEKRKGIEKQYGLSEDLANQVVRKGLDIESLSKEYPNIEPVFLAEYFLNYEKEIKRRFSIEVNVEQYAKELLPRVNKKELPKEAVLELIVDLANGKKINYEAFKVDNAQVEKDIKKIVEMYPHLNMQALMGEVMKTLRGRVEGKKVMELLKKLKKE